jgi:transcription antitermination protein NusB
VSGPPASAEMPDIGGGVFAPRRAARLAAVQGLFSMEMSGASAADVELEGRMGRLPITSDSERDETTLGPEIDAALFAALVSGAVEQQALIDRMIAERLAEGWRLERLDAVVRAILRAGVTELVRFQQTPIEIVINDFVHIANLFFDGPEPAFVNATLDAVARAQSRV